MISKYVTHRRMQGYHFISSEHILHQFDSYVTKIGWSPCYLSRELVEDYIAPRPGEKRATQGGRVSMMRCFGKYLVDSGVDAYVLPADVLPIQKYGFEPYIFSVREVGSLLAASESLGYCSRSPRRHLVMPMLLKLIYSCGLRISEARKLLVSDVDLGLGILLIRATKFNKDRYVPMTRSVQEYCKHYAARVHSFSMDNSPFLPSPRRDFYSSSAIRHAFKQCLMLAGIPHTDTGPTVHCLRHAFAVHRLMKWSAEKEDITALLPYLAAYLGHENLQGTQRYLRMTAEMYPDLLERMQATSSWIIPKVGHHE